MNTQHSNLANGQWYTLSLFEQMGNIGSEVSRLISSKKRNDQQSTDLAFERALKLIDLTASDPRRKKQLKEILRSRELLCDSISENPQYKTTLEDLNTYFTQFAIAARLNR
ncbi:hypothetical protein COX25_00410 [bacterium (Candidatus Howlettbacteria) CG23_combo_of_CG06-09_8_20_14_all_37_9]|nr:MAG: hypothetical protein COX25_00410 [bacterium (Candidatus Howlettbacteria) CG23_combo_of_CG06-09_8_20_14_all_37_9]